MTEEALQEFIAALSKKEKTQITAATPLNSLLPGSLGRARLDAALRNKLGISNTRVYQVKTFGDLCQLLEVSAQSGEAALSPIKPAPLPSFPSPVAGNGGKTIQVGIDLEVIAALPAASDYWEDDFYKNMFTEREIAYALLQPSPQATFAGTWCAKEALRKADPALAQAAWTALEMVHDASGKPSMVVAGKPVAGALSVSHCGEIAAAVFVAAELAQPAPAPIQPVSAPPSPESPAEQLSADSKRGPWSTAIAFLALLISIAALAAAVFHR